MAVSGRKCHSFYQRVPYFLIVNMLYYYCFHIRINGNDRAARAEPSRLELCQVVMEEDDSQNERKHGNNLTHKYLTTDDSD